MNTKLKKLLKITFFVIFARKCFPFV